MTVKPLCSVPKTPPPAAIVPAVAERLNDGTPPIVPVAASVAVQLYSYGEWLFSVMVDAPGALPQSSAPSLTAVGCA